MAVPLQTAAAAAATAGTCGLLLEQGYRGDAMDPGPQQPGAGFTPLSAPAAPAAAPEQPAGEGTTDSAPSSSGPGAQRMRWTAELHDKFVDVVSMHKG